MIDALRDTGLQGKQNNGPPWICGRGRRGAHTLRQVTGIRCLRTWFVGVEGGTSGFRPSFPGYRRTNCQPHSRLSALLRDCGIEPVLREHNPRSRPLLGHLHRDCRRAHPRRARDDRSARLRKQRPLGWRSLRWGGRHLRKRRRWAMVCHGMTSPGAFHALMARRHMELYGTTSDQLGAVAKTFRDHAALNPSAVMRTPFTLADYHASRYICEPLHLLDYCLINDGGVALILTSGERAHDLAQPPVHLRGCGMATALAPSTFPPDDFW